MDHAAFLEAQLAAVRARVSHAVVTILSTQGATPRTSGKLLVTEQGAAAGTIGGGTAEQQAIADAQAALRTGTGGIKTYDARPGSEPGMECGGHVTVLIEVFPGAPRLILCGAGHVGRALIPVAQAAGFHVTLLDSRPREDIAQAADLADQFVPVPSFGQGLREMSIAPGAFYVIATFGHSHDEEALHAALDKRAAYVGMIGSRQKVTTLYRHLQDKGVAPEQLSAVYAPIGLDVGGETPGAIAVSITAELLQVLHGGSGRHMRDCV